MSTRTLTLDAKFQNPFFRWMRNGLLLIFIMMVLFPILGWMYQSFSSAQDARAYPPPGQLIEMSGYKMHLYCLGERKEGMPTVILVTSYPATVSSWVWIQPQIAATTRVCAYDRTGEGWSELSPGAPTFRQMAEELTLLLEKAGETGPYVLVGHSFGGAMTRLFAGQNPASVSGFVWIEAIHPDNWVRQGLAESTLGGMPPEQVAGIPMLTGFGIFRAFPALRGPWGSVPGLPEQQQAELTAYFNTNKWAEHIVAVETALPESLDQLRQAGDLGDLPLTVVIGSASENATGIGLELQRELGALSSQSREYWVEGADHSSLVHQEVYARQTAQAILDMLLQSK